MTRITVALALACVIVLGLPVTFGAAQENEGAPASNEPTLSELAEQVRQLEELLRRMESEHTTEIRELRSEYERALAELRRQLDARTLVEDDDPAAVDDELDQLRREAAEATTEEAEREEQAASERKDSTGRQRSLQATNPEISFLGDVSYDWSDSDIQNRFVLRGAEIGFQSVLDPYTRFKAYLSGHQEPPELEAPDAEEGDDGHGHDDEITVRVEEVYMEWVALPLNSRLRVGKFRQQFGTLNRWHPHALPSTDVPFALQNIFGHEGLIGLGIGFDTTFGRLGPGTYGVTAELVNPDNDSAFAGSHFDDPALLLRLTGFYDLGDDAYFDVGLNGITGPHDEGLDTTIGSVDFNFVWEPVQRARYRGVELRGEFFWTRSDEETGGTVKSQSLYTYLTWKFARRWIVGLRYDNAELPWDRFELYYGQEFREGLREKAITTFLTFWQSEFVRLRLQYQHAERDFAFHRGPEDDNRLWLQATFAAGPHKHDAY